jgi:hypothetical protein
MQEEIEILLKREEKIKRRSMEIQKNYNFYIPDYVLSEIVITEKDTFFDNVIALINLAIINGKLSKENSTILKKDVKNRKVYKQKINKF